MTNKFKIAGIKKLRTKVGGLFNRKHLTAFIGVLLISAGLIGYAQRAQEISDTGQPIPEGIVTEDVEYPDETPIENDSYEVDNHLPRQIIIPQIGVSGYIQRVGLTSEKQVAVPTNTHLSGWYVESVLPGEPGVSLIDGHVSGRYEDGIFKQIKNLSKGDIFEIEFGDRSRKSFEVISVENHNIEDIDSRFLRPIEGIDRQLNLITCGGAFDEASRTYRERVLVQAKAI